ncbi:sugar ABC transporter substrate-binding protein [Lysinibacter sp. HNR]|uniref:sugar ABC transporter substrate-binding protein n=1 Tax=Lysinibacter sp. HNR TaxID=3031408 RepID=UPI00325BC4B8
MSTNQRSSWKKRITLVAVTAGAMLVLAACGGPAGQSQSTVDSPPTKVALITHSAPGDTFWDIVRKGAEQAAQKDNIELHYSSDPDGSKQAQLVQQAIDRNVDGIVVTLAKTDALSDVVRDAVSAGIPVVSINSGEEDWEQLGVLAHFGQNESVAGEAVGTELNDRGAKKAVCVIHEQGNVGLESRCQGVGNTFSGDFEVIYVTGVDMPNVASTITSKLQTSPDIDYVITLGAPFAMTAIDSISDAGSSAKLATFDMNSGVVDAIQAGSIQFLVDQQPYLQGYAAVDNLWLYNTNGNILGGNKTVLTGPQIITSETADTVSEFVKNGTR